MTERERLIAETRRRIDCHDYEALFASGECFRFALCLHEKWGYRIRGVRLDNQSHWAHVWTVKDSGEGIDVRGVYPEADLVQFARISSSGIENVDSNELREIIQKRDYPSDLSDELNKLARMILDNHERFRNAKPLSKEVQQFANELHPRHESGVTNS